MATFDVRPPIPTLAAKNFSGGNQQKIVVAREIEQNPDLLLIGQPTRGVDIGAIEFIHKQIVALRDAGKAILLVSRGTGRDHVPVRPHRRDVRRAASWASRDPETTDERELGLLMAGITDGKARPRMSARPCTKTQNFADISEPEGGHDQLPTWADVVLVPLISLALAAIISALVLLSPSGKARSRRSTSWSRARWGPPMAGATRCTTPPASSSPALP